MHMHVPTRVLSSFNRTMNKYFEENPFSLLARFLLYCAHVMKVFDTEEHPCAKDSTIEGIQKMCNPTHNMAGPDVHENTQS